MGSHSASQNILSLGQLKPIEKGPKSEHSPVQLYYEMSQKIVGKCLILNYEEFEDPHLSRPGSSVDSQLLKKTFKDLKFDARVYDNLNLKETFRLFRMESIRDHSNYYCFVICVLTHGRRNGELFCYDDTFHTKDMFDYFSDEKCPTLAGKPKLFFIQACQGDGLDPGVLVFDSQETEKPIMHNTNHVELTDYCDFLVAYSSYHGFFSFRNSMNGSYFIRELCHVLNSFGTDSGQHLMRLMTMVTHRLAFEFESKTADKDSDKNKKKQLPSIYSTLTRLVRFGD